MACQDLFKKEELPFDEEFLRENCFRLKASSSSPEHESDLSTEQGRKKAYCDLCQAKIAGSRKCLQMHTKTQQHLDNYWQFKYDSIIACLGKPCLAQLKAITLVLESHATSLLSDYNIESRKRTISKLEGIFSQWTEYSCNLRLYGSTLSGFATNESDVNIELLVEGIEELESFQLLDSIHEKLLQAPRGFKNVEGEFDIPAPRVSFDFERLHFVLSVAASSAWEISHLLFYYTTFDPRVAILASCFRYWAHCCGLDRSDQGFWPPHVFPIFVIHFLQNSSPPVLPSIHPATITGNVVSLSEIDATYRHVHESWSTENNKSVGELWVEMLQYYAQDFEISTNVVSLRNPGFPITITSKKWSTTILAVEDPLRLDHNLSRSIGEKRLFSHYHSILVKTHQYFMTPRSRVDSYLQPSYFKLVLKPRQLAIDHLNDCSFSDDHSLNLSNSEDESLDGRSEEGFRSSPKKANFQQFNLSRQFAYLRDIHGITFELIPSVPKFWLKLPPEEFLYVLDVRACDFYRRPPKYCTVCHRCNHVKTECQSVKLPSLITLPDFMPAELYYHLNDVCKRICARTYLDADMRANHQTVLEILSRMIKPKFPTAQLELFGSSCNGFGARTCDLDICLTFTDNPTGCGVDQASTIKSLAKVLRKSAMITNVLPITQAKVPIVKFKIQPKNSHMFFECDISLYNLLASRNTQLLRTYCEIDERVSQLGIVVKKFFKVCRICDASKGSLSSYAYTLMTLYYLQRCKPPVIPVLQELHRGEKPMYNVEGYNTWFFDDLSRLHTVWPYRHRNQSSLGELFLGFLRYFSETFNFQKLVVCTRQLRELTKMEKKWTGKQIAIEDPFLLCHNLGQGLGSEMARYIKASIIMGRNHMGTPLFYPNRPTSFWENHFFNSKALDAGPIPRRGCHYCKIIGHVAAQCPKKNPNLQQEISDPDSREGSIIDDNSILEETAPIKPSNPANSFRRTSGPNPRRMARALQEPRSRNNKPPRLNLESLPR